MSGIENQYELVEIHDLWMFFWGPGSIHDDATAFEQFVLN